MKEIELSKNGTVNKGKFKALVDNDVFDIVNQYDWSLSIDNGKKYACRQPKINGKKTNIYLHVYIWKLKKGDIPKGFEVDHIDGQSLNCQINNLRLATRSENNCNKGIQKNNSSGFKGISERVDERILTDGTISHSYRWTAHITYEKKRYTKSLTYHNDEERNQKLQEIIAWWKQKEKELHKKYAFSNRPKDKK